MSAANRPVVVGGGIVGIATALALAERGHAPIVLEAEDKLAQHQTGHNSGVIHSGLYYKPGSLKARMCREGLAAMYRFCDEEGVATLQCGKLVVAVKGEELSRLDTLEERGRMNGVRLRRLGREGIREREPNVTGLAGLWIEETGVVDYSRVTEAMAKRMCRLGGEVRPGHRVVSITRDGGRILVGTARGEIAASHIINCAGLQSDRVARLAGLQPQVRIVPFRGEYYVLRPDRSDLVRGLIYPVPDPDLPFLGVHFTRGIDGVVEAGPNAVLALKREGYGWKDVSIRDIADWAVFPGFWRMSRAHWRSGLAEIRRSLSRERFLASLQSLIPELQDNDIETGGSGVRAQAIGRDGRLIDDFLIQMAPNSVHLLNAPSPAATASLVIGRSLVDRLLGRAVESSRGRVVSTVDLSAFPKSPTSAGGRSRGAPATPPASDRADGPLVTIGMPVFNASRYLDECLSALVEQTYPHIRIVISDNASTDDTLAICNKYAARDPRITIVRGDRNRGADWNHRRVLQLATGKYFHWQASDDTIAPNFIAACVAALEANPQAVLAYPLTTIIDDAGAFVRKTSDRLPLDASDARVRFSALLSAWPITHSPFYGVMRLSTATALPPYGGFLAADRAFLAELALHGQFMQVEEYLMFRRFHAKHTRQTDESERELIDPEAAHTLPREYQVLRKHLGAAWRAPASPMRKLGYFASVARWVIARHETFILEARGHVGQLVRRAVHTDLNRNVSPT